MNILFVNLPYRGHVIPTIGLVQALVKAGHHVTYLLPRDWGSYLEGTGAVFLGYDNHPRLDKQIRNAFFMAETVIGEQDLLLYEQFFFAGKHLAEKHHKPCARIFTAPATNKTLMADFLSHGGPMGIFRFPLISRLWTADAVKGLDIRLQCRSWLEEIVENPPLCSLVYTLREFQPFAEDFPDYHFLGPSVYERREESFPVLPGPVICISLGTIVKGAKSFFRTCIGAFRDQPVTVVLAVGSAFDIRKLGKTPDNFHIRRHIPQTTVLKQSALFITHGGMNSVSEAMAAGVPMVVLPFVSDQPVNGRQVERLGLGRVLDRKKLTPEILRETALSLLRDEPTLRRCREMKARIAEAPGNAGAVRILEDLVR